MIKSYRLGMKFAIFKIPRSIYAYQSLVSRTNMSNINMSQISISGDFNYACISLKVTIYERDINLFGIQKTVTKIVFTFLSYLM